MFYGAIESPFGDSMLTIDSEIHNAVTALPQRMDATEVKEAVRNALALGLPGPRIDMVSRRLRNSPNSS
jgi:hypothetical protein